MMVISYDNILKDHPWIVTPSQKCILSPDSDGFLCGLFMTALLNWEVSGFYDGKILLIRDGLNIEQCIFLDMDVNRPNVRSMGHHMVLYNKRIEHPNFTYQNCIQPNLLRNYDGNTDFQKKYPFGTIHLLLGLLQHAGVLSSLPDRAIWPLLFTDGTWNNLFGYTENCLDWIEYLKINNPSHILHYSICSSPHSVYSIMRGLNDFLRERDSFDAKGFFLEGEYRQGGRNKRTGDKLRITDSKGNIINLEKGGNNKYQIYRREKERIIGFINRICDYIQIEYCERQWQWECFDLIGMVKGDFEGSKKRLNNKTFKDLMDQNPFSLAMTSGGSIEYTLFPSS
jgi:hypothetical protein